VLLTVGAKWEHKIKMAKTDPRSGGRPMAAVPPSGLIGVGYEGRTVDDLSAQLVAIGVSRVVDVRLNRSPASPG
jgi:hypothetical protein